MENAVAEPRIVRIEPFDVVGVAKRYEPGAPNDIPRLWEAFVARRASVPHRVEGPCYGVCTCSERTGAPGPKTFEYLACTGVSRVGDVPEGMTARRIPGGRYLVFTHRGPIHRIMETVNHIWGTWLPRSPHRAAPTPDFELYDDRFAGEDATSEVDIYVPIEGD